MTEPARYVHILDDVPELDAMEQGPVLVYSLDGFLDAGNAAALATQHLLDQSSGRVVASFDIDAFFDYRARRPPMTFSENRYEGYEPPRLVVRLNHDSLGEPYLLMTGPEPDTHWEAFALAVRAVVEKLRVRLAVSMGAVPMAVPHTRPVMLTNHATDARPADRRERLEGPDPGPGQRPGAARAAARRLGPPGDGLRRAHPALRRPVRLPGRGRDDAGVRRGRHRARVGPAGLEAAGEAKMVEIAAQIEDSAEVRDVVTGLEQQYDAFHRPAEDGDALPLAEEQDLPTGEELGAEFERFLAGLDRPNDPGE